MTSRLNKTLPTPDDSESWRTPKSVYFIGGTHVGAFELDAIEGGFFAHWRQGRAPWWGTGFLRYVPARNLGQRLEKFFSIVQQYTMLNLPLIIFLQGKNYLHFIGKKINV